MTHRTPHLFSRTRLGALILPGVLLAAVALSACGTPSNASSSTSTAAPATSAAPATGAAPAASPVPAGSGSAAVAPVQKANANTASENQVAQALQANGVPNATRWAREVVEYRPYPTDDPTLAKLRQNLAKYNPAPGVVDQIVASLSL